MLPRLLITQLATLAVEHSPINETRGLEGEEWQHDERELAVAARGKLDRHKQPIKALRRSAVRPELVKVSAKRTYVPHPEAFPISEMQAPEYTAAMLTAS